MACARPRWFQSLSPSIFGTWSSSRKPVEAVVDQQRHHFGGIEVALADEALLKFGHGALHVAEVDVDDAALGAEELDHLAHVGRAAGHLRAAAEAEVEAPGGAALAELLGPLEAGRLVEEPRDAAEHRHRRIVGMQREAHARLLGHRQHRA